MDSDDVLWDDVYMGSKRVFLRAVSGRSYCFRSCDWSLCASSVSASGGMCEEYPVMVPGVPALDFKADEDDMLREMSGPLSVPLLKTPHDPLCCCVPYYAVASGVRSALVKIDSTWYRLKGCGNNDEGFPVRTHRRPSTASDTESWREIRGCTFENTAYRELNMTSSLSATLAPLGIVSANKPTGCFFYDHPNQPLGPNFPPVCVVEATIGDRRFGSHVLAGIELILPLLLEVDKLQDTEVRALFPPMRPGVRESVEGSGFCNFPSTGAFITDFALGTLLMGHAEGAKGIHWPDLPRDSSTLADLTRCPTETLPERAPPVSEPAPQQWTNSGHVDMSPKWIPEWNKTCKLLSKHLETINKSSGLTKDGTNSVLVYLFSRCGYDAGRILGGMHKQNISWGTFQDSMCRKDLDEWHCNAHANNLVVIPEGHIRSPHPGYQALLSFLDLDMAFSTDTFLNSSGEEVTIGMSEEQSKHLRWREFVNMMEVLAGNDSSTGVPQVARPTVEAQSDIIKVVKAALYDTLVLSYTRGYQECLDQSIACPTGVPFYDETMHSAAHCIIRLAIIVMANFVA